jgi:hypothetical protein
MNYFVILILLGIIVFIYFNRAFIANIISPKDSETELIKVLLSLEEDRLNELFRLYKNEFGQGAAYYARRTYLKWKAGKVRPSRQTFKRFFVHLPKVMSYDLKCEVLRRLMQEYCPKEVYNLSVFTDDWEEKLTPLTKTIVNKPYTAALPKLIEEKLQWLAQDEMQTAKDILRNAQIQEGKIAVSMLRQEISNVEILLGNVKGKASVRHEINLPYGKINLEIKRR